MKSKTKARKRNPLLTIFPTPTFLAMPSVGLSFSDTHVRFVEFVGKGITKHLELGDYSTIELPKGIIVNGEIQDSQKLIALIAEMKKDFDFMYVRGALPEQKGYLYKTEVPYIEEGDIRDSVGFSLEENAPISINEATFDFDVINVDKKEKKVEVVVTVFPQNVIQDYANVLESAGLTPLGFELEAHAVAKAVVKKDDPQTYIIVHQMGEKVGLYVVNNNVVHFTTTIHLGKESVSGIGGAFSLKSNESKTKEEKRSKTEKNAEVDTSSIQLLKAEITKLGGYWKSQKCEDVSAVLLTGKGLENPKYQHLLSSAIDYKVRIANVWQNVFSFDEYIPDISSSESLPYAAAIGLALPDSN